MCIGEVVGGAGKALVFKLPNLLGELGEVDELQVNGTFWSVPKPFKKPHPFEQLFSLHLTRFGRVNKVFFIYSIILTILYIFINIYLYRVPLLCSLS